MFYHLILLALATAVLLSMTADFFASALRELRNKQVPRNTGGLRLQGFGYALCWAFFVGIWLLHSDDAAAVAHIVATR